jgi:hypothetical protein
MEHDDAIHCCSKFKGLGKEIQQKRGQETQVQKGSKKETNGISNEDRKQIIPS